MSVFKILFLFIYVYVDLYQLQDAKCKDKGCFKTKSRKRKLFLKTELMKLLKEIWIHNKYLQQCI